MILTVLAILWLYSATACTIKFVFGPSDVTLNEAAIWIFIGMPLAVGLYIITAPIMLVWKLPEFMDVAVTTWKERRHG